MFKDKVLAEGTTLLDLLNNDGEKLEAVKTFIAYGRSSVANCSGDEFVQKLVERQYDSYSSIKNLQPEYSYAQYIENPKIENGLITLADVLNDVKLHASDVESLKKQESEDLQAPADLSDNSSKL